MYIIERDKLDINGKIHNKKQKLYKGWNCPKCDKYAEQFFATKVETTTAIDTTRTYKITHLNYIHGNNNICTMLSPNKEEE